MTTDSLYIVILSLYSLSAPVCLSGWPVYLYPSTAKSLQEFAGVLQNLEDERTRMVSVRYMLEHGLTALEFKCCITNK